MKLYVTDIPDENHHEVIWSDVITPVAPANRTRRNRRGPGLRKKREVAAPGDAHSLLAEQIQDVLVDRAQRQLVQASLKAPGASDRSFEPAGAHAFLMMDSARAPALLGIPDLECIDDFVEYLLNRSIRNAVIDRFNGVVNPLVKAGAELEIISHSWGTVVTYEALRLLERSNHQPCHNLFTVGSALAVAPVKRLLLPAASDGQKPDSVQTWINLNAHFDVVGGALRGNPFEVDYEYLHLPAVGCSPIIPNPSCAHESYFRSANQLVNRDIFAGHIQQGVF